MVSLFFPFLYLKKIFQRVLKCRTAFLKSIRFYRHPYQAIVIIMAEMVIMAKMAIITILDIMARIFLVVFVGILGSNLAYEKVPPMN